MKILGIETSCDETAAAIVEGNKVLSSSLATSVELHAKTGGIIPEVAARQQTKSMIPVINDCLKNANLNLKDIDAFAVAYGPGLIGSLLVGVETAKTLSYITNKPLVPINHLKAHIYANWVDNNDAPVFPAVALVVSGGHTDFVLMKSHEDIKWIGGTRDDAAGEAFDKTARIIGLPYPGGPNIASSAEDHLNEKLDLLPRPMIDTKDLDMSFSGLKTSVLNYTKGNKGFDKDKLAAEIQEAIVDTLVTKSNRAIKKYNPKSFLLAGGVSANKRLKEKLAKSLGKETNLFTPNPTFSTDNAVMIAMAASLDFKPVSWQSVSANPSLAIEE